MEFSKLSAPSLKELFVQELEHMILSGKLPVGEKLPPERDLSETMQVSRAVVNAGLKELSKKGFLAIRPRIGAFVADFRKEGTIETLIAIMNYNGGILRAAEVRSILELRIALDTLIVQLVIPKITEEEIQSLSRRVENVKNAPSARDAAEESFHFQHELACLSGNTLVPLIFQSFKMPLITLWLRFCQLYGVETLYQNTNTLLSYIIAKDTEKAQAFISESINNTISGTKEIYF